MTVTAAVMNRHQRRQQKKKGGGKKVSNPFESRHARLRGKREARQDTEAYLEQRRRRKELAANQLGLKKRLKYYWAIDNFDFSVVAAIVVILLLAYGFGTTIAR